MVIVFLTLNSLRRSGTIGQDEVEVRACTIFNVVFKANELTNRSRLEPLLKDRGFIGKFKPGSAISEWANNV